MDAFNDPKIQTVVGEFASQTAKTECLLNVIGYHIDQDPCPILLVLPILDVAKSFSKTRIAPMIRDTPALTGRVSDAKTRDSGNTILEKAFIGGGLCIAGANSPASLSSRPRKKVLCDEIDRYPVSSGTEGNPVSLAMKRADTYWDKKFGLFSSPTVKDMSPIQSWYDRSSRGKYWVPCHSCGEFQVLKWAQIRWEEGKPETGHYVCEKCGVHWSDGQKILAISKGEWRHENQNNRIKGFWLNGIYSPWKNFEIMVRDYEEARKDVEEYKVWVNTFLAECWDEMGIVLEPTDLMKRMEFYGPKLPKQVLLLTCAVDVQDDRLELEVVGWGLGEESWAIQYKVLIGNTAQKAVWDQLDNFIMEPYEHELGIRMVVGATTIDSGGHSTNEVYRFVRGKEVRRIFAIKGSNTPGAPIIQRLKRSKKSNSIIVRIGTATAKAQIYSRLKIKEPGPGFMHYPNRREAGFDQEYFSQLTAEKMEITKRKGYPVIIWKKIRPRNEALDIRAYNSAAFNILNPNLNKYKARLDHEVANHLKEKTIEETPDESEVIVKRDKPKGNPYKNPFVNKYRRR